MIRRSFIKAMTLSPLAPLISSGPAHSPVQVPESLKTAVEPPALRTITKFSEFMTKSRQHTLEREAFDRTVNSPLDPDIDCMRSWSATMKHRVQLARWRRRIIEAERTWFEDIVHRKGFFEDYSIDA